MFSKKDVEAYKSITAPEELKQKVFVAAKNERTIPYRQLQLAAACLAVIVSLTLAWNWNHSVISVQGSEQMVSFATEARETVKTSISIDISSSHKRKVTVSEGSLLYADANGEEVQITDKTVKVISEAQLLWQLDGQTDKQYELKVTGWGKDKIYLLNYNQETEHWEIKEQ